MLKKHYMEPRKGYILVALLSMLLGLSLTVCIIGNNVNVFVDAAAAEIYLNASSGSDGNNGTSRSAAVKTFAKAKELVTAGGTIVICSELALTGDIDGAKTTGTRIKLARKGASEAVSSAYKGKMLSVASGVTVNISNLIVDGGAVWTGTVDATLGRGTTNSGVTATGQLLYNSGYPTITNCDFQNNDSTSSQGGGIYSDPIFFGLSMNGCTVSGNNVTSTNSAQGGGMYLGNADYGNTDNNMSGCTISGNSATSTSSAAQGGGIYCTQLSISDCTISGNSIYGPSSSVTNGGGVCAAGSSGSFKVSGAVNISGNIRKDNNTADNACPYGSKTITLTGDLSGSGKIGITTTTAPTADAPVDVVAVDGTNLTTISSQNKSYFTSDNTSYRLIKSSDSTKIQLHALPPPTFTVTIPESVKSISTTATINLSASLSNFIAGTDNVDVKLTVPTGGLFSLEHLNDSSSVVKYRVKNGSTVFGAGTQTVATFNTTTNSQTLTYEITDTSSAKYAGTYKGTMIYTVAYRES